ncbi:hypothetical protein [Anaerorhabdus sp.]|uniref:hypothetical protein n=1 Tax=Anaerorhabdus sp. TaxID=1872524 RepID=UPI002B20AEFD|nr:hypothetical protein [Anaerorhabdus sp.]MEA4873891.1 hypothetical protein [Anaerorhabdus sp.]
MIEENTFIGYEYKSMIINPEMESLYIDGYHNFGWILESSLPNSLKGGLAIKFKRDRKIRNKAELIRLSRQFDACVEEVNELERSKTIMPTITAFTIGLIGCVCMAISVFAITAVTPNIIVSIIAAIPGFIFWILPYFCYSLLKSKQINKINPLIDKKYDEIYEVCEKANGLLT